MATGQYSEKKRAVFAGIIALMEKGVNPYSIKVADIAGEADIGKGTLYDYFSSKEEAISHAILYNVKNGIDDMFLKVRNRRGFKEKFYEILHLIAERLESNISILRIMLSAGGIQEFYGYLSEYKGELSVHFSEIHDIYDHLTECGIKEGIIRKVEDVYYRDMAFTGAILGFSQYLGQRHFRSAISVEEAMIAAYRILLKALN